MSNSNEQSTNTANSENDNIIENSLTAVQIQQEYFENLADCDWIK